MKILFTAEGENWGGQEERTLEEALWLISQGHEVLLAAGKDSQIIIRAREQGIPAAEVPMGRASVLQGIWKLFVAVRKFRPDVIHTRDSRDTWRCLIFKWMGIATVRSRHWMLHPQQKSTRRWIWQHGSTRLIACAEYMRQVMRENFRFPEDRIDLIGEGADLEKFYPGESGEAIRREWNIPTDAVLFGFVGRLAFDKNPLSFVRAAKKISLLFPRARFLAVGCYKTETPRSEEVESLVAELFADNPDVLRLTGQRSDVPDLMRAFDVFVLPSLLECQSRVIPQAFATGLPVIATNVGGIGDLVKHDITGLLVPPLNDDALAAAMQEMMVSEALRTRLGQAGYDFARKNLSIKMRMQELLECYQKAVNKRSRKC